MKPSSPRPLKICTIGSTFPLNEQDFQVPWLLESLRRMQQQGHQCDVLAPAYEGTSDHKVHGIQVYRFRYAPKKFENLTHGSGAPNKLKSKLQKLWVIPYLISACLRGALLAWREQYDIIHVHWSFPHGVIAIPMRWVCGAAVINTCHGAELALARKSAWIAKVLRWILRTHTLLNCNSSHTRAQMRHFSGRNARIFPYGSSIPVVRMENRALQELDSRPLQLLFCGRLIERKGLGYLLQAMPELVQKFNARLAITGEGNCKDEWIALRDALKLQEQVTFHGFVDEVTFQELYANCDIYVHPAIYDSRGDTEGLGVVLIEALAYAKPVIASGVGGIVDVILHEKTGLLVEEKNPRALVQAVERLVSQPDWARSLGEAGREHVQALFNWESITRKQLRQYRLAAHFCKGRRLTRKHHRVFLKAMGN